MPDASTPAAAIDPRQPVEFTPLHYGADAAEPVYLVKPATLTERASFRAAVTAAAGPYPSDRALIAAIRDAIAQVEGVDTTAAGEVLAAYEAALQAQGAALRDGGEVAEVAAELAEAFEQLVIAAGKVAPGVRQILEARQLRTDHSLIIAFRMFVVGWRGADLPPFERGRAGVAADAMERVPEDDIFAAGAKALELLSLGARHRGNFASRRPSLSGPATSPTAPSPTGPTSGSSSESATTSTPPA